MVRVHAELSGLRVKLVEQVGRMAGIIAAGMWRASAFGKLLGRAPSNGGTRASLVIRSRYTLG